MVFASLLALPAIAVLGAAAGIWLTTFPTVSRRLVPFGGGILLGVAGFWILPEIAEFFGWAIAAAWIGAGVAILALIDHYVYPVCPACAPAHDHEHCATSLHGFATPLLIAAALHSALDGWSVMAGSGLGSFGTALALAVAAHKVPEGMALGVIARSALPTRASALAWCSLAQVATLAGGGMEAVLAPYVSTRVLFMLLALAGGSFLYLGGHAVHGELRRSGPAPAFVPALTGVAGPPSVLRLFLR